MSKSRLLSLIVSGFYLITIICLSGKLWATNLVTFLVYLSMSLVCMWFGDEIGPFLRRGRYPGISPDWGFFVRFAGWVFLFLPVIIFIFKKMK